MFPFFALAVLTLLCGCSGHGGVILFEPLDGGRPVTQNFRQAFITNSDAGSYDIVLLDSAADRPSEKPRKDKTLDPIPLTPLQQVMHIHLFWRPQLGTEKNPAAVNTSIDWYVLGADGQDVLLYEGAGFVVLSGSSLILRDGQVSPKTRRGEIQDPIGPAHISGSATVTLSDFRVRDTITQLRQQLHGAETQAASTNGH
jgi:hypothetical protein